MSKDATFFDIDTILVNTHLEVDVLPVGVSQSLLREIDRRLHNAQLQRFTYLVLVGPNGSLRDGCQSSVSGVEVYRCTFAIATLSVCETHHEPPTASLGPIGRPFGILSFAHPSAAEVCSNDIVLTSSEAP